MKRIQSIIIALVAALLPALASTLPADSVAKPEPFVWGAEVGTSIDMGGDDMSALNVNAIVGYRNSWLQIAGIGVGIQAYMANSNRSYPIFAIARSAVIPRTSVLFGELRIGTAINQISGDGTSATFYIRPGIGVNLAKGRKFTSYLILSYTYNDIKFPSAKTDVQVHGLNLVDLTLGITF